MLVTGPSLGGTALPPQEVTAEPPVVSTLEGSRASDRGLLPVFSSPLPAGVGAAPSWEGGGLALIARAGRQAHDRPIQPTIWAPAGVGRGRAVSGPSSPRPATCGPEGGQWLVESVGPPQTARPQG